MIARLCAWAGRPEPLALGKFLVLAFALRLPAILWSRGFEFADQQFQYVDPAYHLAFGGTWWRTWEYEAGMRSWAYPWFLAGVFRILHALGLTEPATRMAATRAVHAAISLLPLAALWLALTRFRPVPHSRAVCLFAAVSGLVVYVGVQPNAPWFAAGFAVTGVLLAAGPGRVWPALAGACLGVAFLGRAQDGLLMPVVVGLLLWQRRWRAALECSLASALLIVAQGLVDLRTWGSFLHSPIEYVRQNLVEGAAAKFGHDPLWLYLAAAAVATAVAPGWLRSLRDGARTLPFAFVAGTVYLVLHALLERKAVRFVVPALILLAIVAAAGAFGGAGRRAHRRALVVVHVALLGFFSCFYYSRGPIEATLALRAEPDLRTLYLVDAHGQDQLTLGGHYYLDRREGEVAVVVVARAALESRLAQEPAPRVHLLVGRDPLPAGWQPQGWTLEPLGAFEDAFDLRTRNRRFVYRLTSGRR